MLDQRTTGLGPEGGRHVVGTPPTDCGTTDAHVVDVGGVSPVGQLERGASGVEDDDPAVR